MVRPGPLVTGSILLVIGLGFQLRISFITSLVPGSYAGLPYTGYIGFGFILSGITSLAAAFSGSRSGMPYRGVGRDTGGSNPGAANWDMTLSSMQRAQLAQMMTAGSRTCPVCGAANGPTAAFCQTCGTSLAPKPAPSG